MLEPQHIAAYIFEAFSLIYFLYLTKKHRKEMWEAIRGDDKKLQLPEIAAFFWFILFPILFFGDLFFGLDASDKVWYSMDVIFLFIIGGYAAVTKKLEQ